jgi:hypothetical protein
MVPTLGWLAFAQDEGSHEGGLVQVEGRVVKISTVGRPRRAVVILQCWLTTLKERGIPAKLPIQPIFLGLST